MTDNKPKLSLVSSGDPRTVEMARAERKLCDTVSELTADLLRIMHGEGLPADLAQQIISLGEQLVAAQKSGRAEAMWFQVEQALQSAIPDHRNSSDEQATLGVIARGSLQFLAARLMHQSKSEALGKSDMLQGARELRCATMTSSTSPSVD